MGISFPNESAEYRAARDQLLEKEIGLRRAMEAVAAARRALPAGGLAPEDYVFDGLGPDGSPAKIRLSEIFAPGRESLIIYNFMFPRHKSDQRPGPEAGKTADLPIEESPCPSCVAMLDQLDGAAHHLEAAGFNFVVVADTSVERLVTFGRERGWKRLRLLSSAGNSFKRDYNAVFEDGQQAPMLTVFHQGPDGIRHFWSSELLYAEPEPGQDPRHVGTLEPLWNMMDLTPEGRPDWDEQIDYESSPDIKPARVA